jgi:hypothetical protein
MMIRSNLRQAANVLAILMILSSASAQQSEQRNKTAQSTLNHGTAGGILTDRLNKSQLKIWESIVGIVLARDKEGRPTHPKLYGLYQQTDASGHEIHIELSTDRETLRAAGICRIELGTGKTQKDAVLIRLNLGMIDRAITSEHSRRADGFIPLARLAKTERYAEVLGHELAHTIRLLTDSDYRDLYLERQALADAGSRDIQVIGSLTSSIEKPAESAEVEIWRELTAGREPKL